MLSNLMKKDSFILGTLIGAVAPIVAYLLSTFSSLQQSIFPDKPIAMYVFAAVINLIVVRFTYRAGYEKLAKGIVLITFLAMILLIFGTKLKV